MQKIKINNLYNKTATAAAATQDEPNAVATATATVTAKTTATTTIATTNSKYLRQIKGNLVKRKSPFYG